jgi:hypothetical protein
MTTWDACGDALVLQPSSQKVGCQVVERAHVTHASYGATHGASGCSRVLRTGLQRLYLGPVFVKAVSLQLAFAAALV